MKIWKRLKSIEQIKKENQGDWSEAGSEVEYWSYEKDIHWIINDTMIPNFGDGKHHEFERVEDCDTYLSVNYTHMYEEWYYNELWFVDEVVEFGISEKDWEF